MPLQELKPGDLRLSVDAKALGFTDTSELQHLPLPWIGQSRAEAAARFGMEMTQPDYNLFVLGEVGSGRTTLLGQMMQAQATKRPVPPDLCYLHNFDEPEHPRAFRMPAGQGRQLRQLMTQLTKRLQAEIPKRLAQDDFKAESQRIQDACTLEKDRGYEALSAYAEAHSFGLMRDEGHMVFTLKDEKGEPVTAGQALARTPQQRLEVEKTEEALRNEISRYLEKTQSMERVMNEGLAALRRQTIQPLLAHELQLVRNGLQPAVRDAPKLAQFLEQVHLQLGQQQAQQELQLF